MLNTAAFSKDYIVRLLTAEDSGAVLEVENGNPQYYLYCPPSPSEQSFLDDLKALPPRKTMDDKYYFGYFEKSKSDPAEGGLVAIVDLITAYPNPQTAFIGFFMMNIKHQGKGEGSRIVQGLASNLKQAGFGFIRLGYMKGNEQSKAFWIKNGFVPTGVETDNGQGIVVIMEKALS